MPEGRAASIVPPPAALGALRAVRAAAHWVVFFAAAFARGVIASLLAACAAVQPTSGCPGDRIGTLDCSGALCQMRYDGEVFTLMREPPPDASRLLALTDVGRFTRKLWYASNTGKFKVYVGGPNHGAAYLFEKSPNGWTAQIERDAYACTD